MTNSFIFIHYFFYYLKINSKMNVSIHSNQMKIALCLSGELRFFDNILIKTNFDKFIFKFEPDLFISTWKHFGESMNHGYINPFDNVTV